MRRVLRTATVLGAGLLALLTTGVPAGATTAETANPDSAAAAQQSYTYRGITYSWTAPDASDITATPTPGEPDRLPPGVDPADIPDSTPPGTLAPDHVQGNGCTNVPDSFLDADFYPACEKHDACYSADSDTSRLNCDGQLYRNLSQACADAYSVAIDPRRIACNDTAFAYFGGVRAAGWAYYEGRGSPLSVGRDERVPAPFARPVGQLHDQ